MAWSFEDKFNSDTKSIGDLNGQDGWSGITTFDVQNSVVYQGDQAIVETSGGGGSIDVSISAVSDGTVYFAMRRNSTTGDSTTAFMNGTTTQFRISFELAKIRTDNGGSVVDLLNPYVANTWYLFEVIFDANNTHTIRIHDGSSWSSSFGPYTATNTSDINAVRLNSGGTNSQYWDIITGTNPLASGPSNLKSLDTNLKANIKSYNTNLIANIKSIDTNA